MTTSITRKEVAGTLSRDTRELNEALHDIIVPSMAESSMPPGMLYANYATLTARAVFPELRKSDEHVIAAQPAGDQMILALVRRGLIRRLPVWLEEAAKTGDPKPYKAVYKRAKAWVAEEVRDLRNLPVEALSKEARRV